MRVSTYVVILFGSALLLPLSAMSAGEFKLEDGFKLVFNGKNFDGWQIKGKKEPLTGKTEAGPFKVVDGGVHFKGGGYIETTKEYTEVVVRFDFKPGPKCNNDFFIRGIKFDIVLGGKETKEIKEGQWSTCEIIAKGNEVIHKIDGKVARTTKSAAKAAPFIMRAETGEITVKNIRVKE